MVKHNQNQPATLRNYGATLPGSRRSQTQIPDYLGVLPKINLLLIDRMICDSAGEKRSTHQVLSQLTVQIQVWICRNLTNSMVQNSNKSLVLICKNSTPMLKTYAITNCEASYIRLIIRDSWQPQKPQVNQGHRSA